MSSKKRRLTRLMKSTREREKQTHTKRHQRVRQMLENSQTQITEKEKEFCVLAEEICIYRSDPSNHKFTQKEEEEARKIASERGEKEEGKKEMEGWSKVLQKLLVAIWKVETVEKAAFKT